MIESIFKKITKFYQASLVIAILMTLGTVLYFWQLGFIDGSKGKELHKASYIMESFAKKDQFREVKDLIYDENPKDAIQKIKEFEIELEKVNEQVKTEEFDDLKRELQVLKNKAATLIAFTKTSKVISVFNGKLNKFYHYVKENNWRTLTRMSDRIYSKVSGHLNKSKIDDLAENVMRDFGAMIKITENSVLDRKNKSEIVSRITNLQIEMEMLKSYATKRVEFDEAFTVVNQSLQNWIDKVSPEVTLNKIKAEDIGRFYVLGMMAILFVLSTLFFSSFLFNKWSFKRSKRELEEKIEDYINDGILGDKRAFFDEFSDEFKYFSENISSYIDKRMSFGSIFQDALPLSSILLDQNLKVVWANKQFCDDWQISEDEIKKDYMSWDYLNKLTNLGHDDPVLEALKHNIAGIYQVKVKPNDEADVRPYEMFVSPVSSKGENKIMLFFYDLTNLEETIKHQSIGILNPVKNSVDNLIQGHFVADEQMEYEFKIAGIEDIYEKFISLNEDIIKSENELLDQIEASDLKIRKLKNHLESLESKNRDSLQMSKANVEALKVFKDNVIGLSTLSKNLDDLTVKSEELINTNINALRNSTHKVSTLKKLTAELVEAMPKFYNIKEEIRAVKNVISENRNKLAQELTVLSTHLKRATDAAAIDRIGRSMQKISESFAMLNSASDELDKKLSGLDVIMSKAQMIMNTGKDKIAAVNAEYEQSQIDYSMAHLQNMKKLKGSSSSKLSEHEEHIIDALGKIFKANKENLRINGEISHIQLQASHIATEARVNQ